MRRSYTLGLALSIHGETFLSSLKNLNCIRLNLSKGKIGISMSITHKQGFLTSFLSFDILAQIMGNFP
jgi:hypothetical protein